MSRTAPLPVGAAVVSFRFWGVSVAIGYPSSPEASIQMKMKESRFLISYQLLIGCVSSDHKLVLSSHHGQSDQAGFVGEFSQE
jgi:hypothetical protein